MSVRESVPPVIIMDVDEQTVPDVPAVNIMPIDKPAALDVPSISTIEPQHHEQVVPTSLGSHLLGSLEEQSTPLLPTVKHNKK